MYQFVISGGTFTLYIKFDENFNIRPPEVCFHTIPFHPNGKCFRNLKGTSPKNLGKKIKALQSEKCVFLEKKY